IDGKDARAWTSEQVSKAVRGERDTPVTLKVERAGALAPQYFTITRDTVPLPSIRTSFMIRPGTGYVALVGGFNHTTSDELQEALDTLHRQGMRQLVLVHRNTASASEIVAGAIQDYGRGLLVGETSFGKGLVQRVFELRPWGAGLTLTTQKYYTPYGRSIQRDYSSGSLYDYYVRHSPEDEPTPQTPSAPSIPARRDQSVSLTMPTPQA